MRGGDILIECLKAQGVRCIFGMPGVQNSQIYDSLFRCAKGVIDHYLVRHEFAATKMADGYARATGEVGVALTVPGPGASNASTGYRLKAISGKLIMKIAAVAAQFRLYLSIS